MTLRTVLASAALLASISPCWSQRASEFFAVKGWQGTLKLKGDYVGKVTGGAGTDDYSFSWSADMQFRLDEFVPLGQYWHGKFTGGRAAVRHKNVNTNGNCTLTTTLEGEGLPTNTDFFLYVGPGENYRFALIGATINGHIVATTVCGGSSATQVNDRPEAWFTSAITRNLQFDLPATGFDLAGSGKYEMGTPLVLFSVLLGGGTLPRLLADVNWTFQPLEVDPLELTIELAGYDTFRPIGSLGGGLGNSLDVTATLQTKSGKPAPQGAAKFVFELLETSQEPGVAMNWPRDASDQDYDFRIAASTGLILDDPVKRQKAETIPKVPLSTSASLTIDSFDWGSWSRLKVTAVLVDGTKIEGYLKGDPNQTEVRLPKRAADSFIADSWKKDKGVSGADSSDEENDPNGDSNSGDGLTLYEEYRGFYESQAHIEGNPKKKDYFAVNLAGSEGDGGLALFKQLSGLMVHSKFLQTELSSERVINKNVRVASHRVDQHGVILRVQAFEGYARAVGGPSGRPSTPKDIQYVGLPVTIGSRSTLSPAVSYQSSTIAHELFHTVNLYHHGEVDRNVTWNLRPDDTVLESADPIQVYNEPDVNTTARLIALLKTLDGQSLDVSLGMPQGQHSGAENCVMRYDIATAYRRDGEVGGRFHVAENPGAALCDSAEGTGVNLASRVPQSRYGDAAVGRGYCKQQILVNDAIAAPTR